MTQPKLPFPSARQARCPGLRRQLYPAYLRDLIDVDYADKLGEAERVWLSGFLEEHYKGYRLRGETQLHPIEKLREADAARKRVSRAEDVLAFTHHRAGSLDDAITQDAQEARELAVLAGSRGRDAHELRGRNYAEDDLISMLDSMSKL